MRYILELKFRLMLIALSVVLASIVSYVYKDTIMFIILAPYRIFGFNSIYFIFTDVTEVAFLYLMLVTFVDTHVLLLFSSCQCFIFFSPALFKKEYLFYFMILKVSIFMCCVSLILSSYIIIPFSWKFFIHFQEFLSNKFVPLYFEAKLTTYFMFYISTYYACLIYMNSITVLILFFYYFHANLKTIKKLRKIIYYFLILVSTLLTPPDIFSQIITSLVLICFYELFVISFVFYYKLKLE